MTPAVYAAWWGASIRIAAVYGLAPAYLTGNKSP